MPAIRDFAQGYHATTTYRHVESPMPAYAAGDMLLASVSIDDSAPSALQNMLGGLPFDYVYYNDDTSGTPSWTDYTPQASDSVAGDWYMTPLAPTVNDCIYFGGLKKFSQLNVLNSVQGVATTTPTWAYEYWNGSIWTALTLTTNSITTLKFANTVHAEGIFTPPADWAATTVWNSASAYFIRWRCTATGPYTTRPVSSQAWMIPVPDGNNCWRQLFAYYGGTTPAPLTALWKIASATEVDTTFFYTTAETANVELISIRDVQAFADSGPAALTVNVNAANRTFIRTTGSWVTAGFAVGMQILPSGNATAANNYPRQIESITTTTNANDTITVTSGTAMVTESGNGDERIIAWPFNSNVVGGGTGSGFSGFTNGNNNTYRHQLPALTTTKDDCLIVYAVAPDGVSVPSIIEGACQLIAGKDGTAHSDGCAWGYQRTAGAVQQPYVSKMAAVVTEMATIAVNPPHGGATVRPGYTAADDSVYVSPMTGAAFGSDSVPAATLTTPFSGTINGKPVANGGSTVTRSDVGLNSYHAMVNFTGVATPGSWGGIRCTIASRNLASKNILFHIQPYLPVDIQTTDGVSLVGACGVAIGLASGNGAFKVWHVGGAGVVGDTQRHQPVIIHTDATPGVLQSTGSPSFGAVIDLGFMVSGKIVAPNWLVGSVWVLDTAVLGGGIAAEPLNLGQIVQCYANGHERRSAIRQGANQALFLGPIQIGDGGTNGVYLNLDATAIEFPRQYDKDRKEVYYNSIDNYCGLLYYPGASDTIIHKNSLVSSPSRFKWGLHASASASASYDFSGTAVIGAGTITLNKAITITGLTINDYSTLDMTGLTFVSGVIKGMPAGNDSVTLVSAALTTCVIDVRGVTAGNRWCSVASPAIFTSCAFTGSGSTGHAIRITTPGTYAMVGNTFTGFGADGSNFAAIFNDSGGLVTLDISGGGGTPTIRNGAGASTVVNNTKTLTVTGLVSGSEVRIYTHGTTTELSGTESSGASHAYAYNYAAGTYVDIVVLAMGYLYMRIDNYLLTNADASLPVQQQKDRQYFNP